MTIHRIRKIVLTPVRVPVPQDRINCPEFPETLNRAADGNWGGPWVGDVHFFVVQVEGEEGLSGWGDTSRGLDIQDFARCAEAMIGFEPPESDLAVVDAVDAVITAAVKRVSRENPDRKPLSAAYFKGLCTAVLDWVGKVRGKPMHAFFGKQMRDSVRIEYFSGFRTPAGAARIARKAKSLGFEGLKLKGNLKIDPAGIAREVLAACGPDFNLNIDPNGRWDTFENFLERAKAIVAVNPNVLLEDPLYGPLEPIARVRKLTGVRVARSVGNLAGLAEVQAAQAADAINVVGEWGAIRDVGAAVYKAGLPCWLGSGLECGFTVMAAIHMGSTLPACTLGSDQIAHLMREDDLLAGDVIMTGGFAHVPQTPGLGHEPDLAAIDRYRIGEPIIRG